jgi:hypothetical protein
MVHPYWGTLVVCAQLRGEAHPVEHVRLLEMCDVCGRTVEACEQCHVLTSCCPCAERHALECPWPL